MGSVGRRVVAPRLAALGFAASACTPPSWSPPARPLHPGPPRAIEAGDAQIGGSYSRYGGGGGRTQIGVAEDVALEAGLAHGFQYTMGTLGAVWTPWDHAGPRSRHREVLELSAGPALGVGGERCERAPNRGHVCDGIPWSQRGALGGYLGAGFGLDLRWFSLFARTTAQLSGAHNTYLTFYWTAMVGAQVTVRERLGVFVQTGGFGVHNADLRYDGWNPVEVGLTIYLPNATHTTAANEGANRGGPR